MSLLLLLQSYSNVMLWLKNNQIDDHWILYIFFFKLCTSLLRSINEVYYKIENTPPL